MSEEPLHETSSDRARADETAELRTIGFRMREIQRLLAVRVEQENRRLEDEGIDPVEEPRFREPQERVAKPDEE